MAGRPAVGVTDFNRFRRDLRNANKVVAKELQTELKQVAQMIAGGASAIAPRRTGAMAARYRGSAAGSRAVVRNTVFYSRFIEFGFHPGGGTRFVDGQHPIGRVIEREEDRIVDEIGDAIEHAAEKMGWQ